MEGMQGLRGAFNPSYFDVSTKELIGTVVVKDPNDPGQQMELFAVIRKASRLKWTPSSEFKVSILGVADDEMSSVVLSWPKKQDNPTDGSLI